MENHTDKIQDYIDGLLSADEKIVFETELLKNPVLAEEVALQRNIQAVITKHIHTEKNTEALKSTLSGFNKEYFVHDKKPAKEIGRAHV